MDRPYALWGGVNTRNALVPIDIIGDRRLKRERAGDATLTCVNSEFDRAR
jgi:hypothetical protein